MPSKRDVLDQLNRDELLAAADRLALDVRDRRGRGTALEAPHFQAPQGRQAFSHLGLTPQAG